MPNVKHDAEHARRIAEAAVAIICEGIGSAGLK
jgi:hypothetical protein